MNNILRFIDNKIEDQFDVSGLKILEKISALPGVVPPVTALPDFHWKAGMEAPSSISVGVKGALIPHLTSSSVNCGMGAVATVLKEDDIHNKVADFYDAIRRNRDNENYILSKKELFDVLINGAPSLEERYGISKELFSRFENGGRVNDVNEIDLDDVTPYLPEGVLNHPEYSGMTDLGVGFGGNHFLEIQKVTEIFDQETCRAHGISEPGQIVMMYHGGGGIIPGFLGGYFARRSKGYNQNIRLVLDKLIYHLGRVQDFRSIPEIYKYYFSPRSYVRVDENTKEGQRFIGANTIAMNYGYAYRLFMIIRIRDALKEIFGINNSDIQLIKDISHNSIQKETINGNELWMHRHNSARVSKGELTVLPGYNNTSSYICAGLDKTSKTLNTVPHGAGDSIKSYQNKGLSKKIKDRFTMVFRDKSSRPEYVEHYTDEGVDAVIRELKKETILTPIAKTTPVAVLKNYR